MLQFGVGEKKDDSARKYMAIRGDAVPGGQVGVYLDTLILVLTCNEPHCCYLFWMVGNTDTGNGKGHGLVVKKEIKDKMTLDPLSDWKGQLRTHGLAPQRILECTHLSQVSDLLQGSIGCSAEMGESVTRYLKGLNAG